MSTKQGKPSNKPNQGKRKGGPPGQKLDQEQSLKLDRRDEEQAGAINASPNTPVTGVAESAALADPAQLPAVGLPADVVVLSGGEIIPAAVPSFGVFARWKNSPIGIGIQSITATYANYIAASLQEIWFGEKLLSAQSFEKAIETQTESTKRTYAEFFIVSQKIFELNGELAKQTFRSWDRAWCRPLSEARANEALTAVR